MNMYAMKGNLSINEVFFNSELLEQLKDVRTISAGIDEIIKKVKNHELYAYDFRATDSDEAFDLRGGGRNVLIVSPAKIHDDKYAYQSKKSEWNITSPVLKEKTMNVDCWVTSEHHEVTNPDGNEIDVYVISPIPKQLGYIIKDPFDQTEKYPIVIKKLESSKELSIAALYIPTLSETYRQIEVNQKENNTLRELLHKKDNDLSDKNTKLNLARELLNQKILVGYGKPQTPFEKGLDLVWVVGGVFAGAFGYGMPELIPQLAGKVTPWMGAGAMMVLMIAVRHISEKRRPPLDKVKEQGDSAL